MPSAPVARPVAKATRKRTTSNAGSDLTRLHLWQIQWVRDVLVIAAIVALIWLGYAMRDVTVPLLVALLLAYLFEPIISRLANSERFPLGRAPVIGGTLAIIGGGVLIVLALATPMVITQTSSLVSDVQSGRMRERLTIVAEEHAPELVREEVVGTIGLLPSAEGAEVMDEDRALLDLVQGSGDWALAVLGGIARFGLLAFLIPFYFFFFSLWFPDMSAFCRTLVPDDDRDRIERLLARMDGAVAGFVRGRVVIAVIMGSALAVGWMICGVPYAIVLGIVIGVFCIVPFLGLVGIPLSIGLLLLDQLGVPEAERMAFWGILLWPTLVFAVVQALDGWILTPAIAGKATNLDPVTIFVAVLAGGSVLGAYGMLLAIPVAACIKILLQEEVLPQLRAWARGEVCDPLPIDRD